MLLRVVDCAFRTECWDDRSFEAHAAASRRVSEAINTRALVQRSELTMLLLVQKNSFVRHTDSGIIASPTRGA